MRRVAVFFVSFLILYSIAFSVGGPYEPDEHTVLLMHFNGDLSDTSGVTAGGTGHGNYAFIPSMEGFGQCIYFDNNEISDSSCVTVPDTAPLDLTGSYTVEAWFYILTNDQNFNQFPRIVAKSGGPSEGDWWRAAFWMYVQPPAEIRSGCRVEGVGWHGFRDLRFDPALFETGKWYHLMFVFDTTYWEIRSYLHDENDSLLAMLTMEINDPKLEPPATTDGDLTIGYGGFYNNYQNDSWFDGFIDEVRISNCVRTIPLPPIISHATDYGNTYDNVGPYAIMAEIRDESAVAKALIKYNTGTGWQEVEMSTAAGDTFIGYIPGQPKGTSIKYYIMAIDDDDMINTVPAGAKSRPDTTYYGFWIVPDSILSSDDNMPMYSRAAFGTPGEKVAAGLIAYSSCTLSAAIIHFDSIPHPGEDSLRLHVYPWYEATGQPMEVDKITPIDFAPQDTGWQRIDILSHDTLILSPDSLFFIVLEYIESDAANMPYVSYDASRTYDRSFINWVWGGWWGYPYCNDFLIRVEVLGHVVGVDEERALPKTYVLQQNWPNPVIYTTTISYQIPKQSKVSLKIYDVSGRLVKMLVNEFKEAGTHQVTWNGKDELDIDISAGIYFYQLITPEFTSTKKLILLK
ncbi:MAG TPA: T9SS type A sorting domain-containing protein [bacterium (Candidatus Stahlbacteria)]|nr:T9SS type A sorting domain-containing protein [Candidatus Stahlbacteria bacterium]